MSNQLSQALSFLFFAAVSFVAIRALFNHLARSNRAALAAPILIVVGAISAVLFLRMQLQQFFIWHLILFALIVFHWHAKSRVEDRKLIDMARQGAAPRGTPEAEVVQSYAMTRRLLSFGLVSYLAAFCTVYYYLFTRG
ncbi:MAG TPA: hypothetical protein VIH40_03050 [Xanthobacteraceae bacterium]